MTFLKGLIFKPLMAIALLAICSFLLEASGLSNITLSPGDLQSIIDGKIPIEVQGGFLLTEAKVDLSNDKINLEFKARSRRLDAAYELLIKTTSELEYHADKGQFYLNPQQIDIESIQAGGELSDLQESFLTEDAQTGIAETLKKTPVYNLMGSFKGYLAGKALEAVTIKDNQVIAHLSLWRLAVELVTGFRSQPNNLPADSAGINNHF